MVAERIPPKPRMAPLPVDHDPELADLFAGMERHLGFVANSRLIMQRKPKILRAYVALHAAVWDPVESEIDRPLKRLIAHVASRASGCQYCMAHTIEGAALLDVDERKLAAIWDYASSPLFSESERVVLDFAFAAAQQPNAVTDDDFVALRAHYSEEQIVEIVAAISIFGFLNRFNDTMATPLEEPARHAGEKYLASHGWSAGRHDR